MMIICFLIKKNGMNINFILFIKIYFEIYSNKKTVYQD